MADHLHKAHYKKTGYWGRRAAGCLFVAKNTGRICFALRSKYALQPLTYGTWGGAMDGNETPLEAVLREAWEETGITVSADNAHPLYIFRHGDKFEYHNFLVELDQEISPKLNWENADFTWAKFGEWPNPLHPGVQDLFKHAPSLHLIKTHAEFG